MDKLKQMLKSAAKDWWIIALDAVAVNAAYLLALLIRFYVNFEFRPTVTYYLTDFFTFAPFYTVLSLIVFAAFRLYGGLWRYAGLNDLNRIIAATVTTSLFHVVGTLLFIRRMPITYYVIGAILQMTAIILIRFAYRIVAIERREISKRRLPAANALIVGVGETGRKVISQLAADDSHIYRPVCIVDDKHTDIGKSLDGIPVLGGMDHLSEYVNEYKVQSIFIAEPLLATEKRSMIRRIAEEYKLEFHDYSGFVSNLGGRLSLTELLSVMNGPVEIEVDGKQEVFCNGEEALMTLTDRYQVKSIDGRVRICLSKQAKLTAREALMREYAAVMGEGSPENVGG